MSKKITKIDEDNFKIVETKQQTVKVVQNINIPILEKEIEGLKIARASIDTELPLKEALLKELKKVKK